MENRSQVKIRTIATHMNPRPDRLDAAAGHAPCGVPHDAKHVADVADPVVDEVQHCRSELCLLIRLSLSCRFTFPLVLRYQQRNRIIHCFEVLYKKLFSGVHCTGLRAGVLVLDVAL